MSKLVVPGLTDEEVALALRDMNAMLDQWNLQPNAPWVPAIKGNGLQVTPEE